MTSLTVSAQILLCQANLMKVWLSIEAAHGMENSGLELSTVPWKNYTALDYNSPELYCHSCLVDLNSRDRHTRDARHCHFPMMAPGEQKVVSLEVLRTAERFLMNPKNEDFFDKRATRIWVAGILVSYLKLFDQMIDPALVEFSESE